MSLSLDNFPHRISTLFKKHDCFFPKKKLSGASIPLKRIFLLLILSVSPSIIFGLPEINKLLSSKESKEILLNKRKKKTN